MAPDGGRGPRRNQARPTKPQLPGRRKRALRHPTCNSCMRRLSFDLNVHGDTTFLLHALLHARRMWTSAHENIVESAVSDRPAERSDPLESADRARTEDDSSDVRV